MYIVVVGCGRVGARLAQRLHQSGHEVMVVDESGASFARLDLEFRGRTLEGNVLSRDVLNRIEIDRADAVAAVTSSDTTNAVVGHVVRKVYRVPNVVVRNYDPRFLPIHEAFGFEVVSSTAWGARQIEEMLFRRPGTSVLSLGGGDVAIYEVRVPRSWNGRSVGELLGPGCVAVALTRSSGTSLPAPGTVLEAGDVLHVSATPAGIEGVRRRLPGGD
jgi:trk system potassium uptake protein TrkA